MFEMKKGLASRLKRAVTDEGVLEDVIGELRQLDHDSARILAREVPKRISFARFRPVAEIMAGALHDKLNIVDTMDSIFKSDEGKRGRYGHMLAGCWMIEHAMRW